MLFYTLALAQRQAQKVKVMNDFIQEVARRHRLDVETARRHGLDLEAAIRRRHNSIRFEETGVLYQNAGWGDGVDAPSSDIATSPTTDEREDATARNTGAVARSNSGVIHDAMPATSNEEKIADAKHLLGQEGYDIDTPKWTRRMVESLPFRASRVMIIAVISGLAVSSCGAGAFSFVKPGGDTGLEAVFGQPGKTYREAEELVGGALDTFRGGE